MATYTVRYSDSQCVERERFEADDDGAAADRAIELAEEWVRGGEWGDGGASVDAAWMLFVGDDPDGETDPIDSGSITVEIEPDHTTLMRRAGAPKDCDHDFVSTYEVDGGIEENPGVWSTGGTTMVFRCHCRHCGLVMREVRYGSQRNPGQADTVEYSMPETADADE
jgi:hypothetical protein